MVLSRSLSLIALFLVAASPSACALDEPVCTNRQETLTNSSNFRLVAISCETSAGAGSIAISVSEDGEPIQELHATYKSQAYFLEMDNTFDIDLDGSPDLSVNTGKGRDANGMHYWLYDASSNQYTDLGEAPHLTRAEDGGLFALVSSGGEMSSIRYNYLVSAGKLTTVNAIGFVPVNDGLFYIVEFATTDSGDLKPGSERMEVGERTAMDCMDGTAPCPSPARSSE